MRGVETGFGYVRLVGFPIIMKHPGSRIVIGRNVTLVSHSKGNVAGINHPVIIATMARNALIEIDDNSGISGASIVAVKKVTLAQGVGLGVNVSVWDTDFHPADLNERRRQKNITDAKSAPISIGREAWIGGNTVVLKGVTIGEAAVVGACSVVTKDIPGYQIAAGNPARLIGTVEKEK
jgi:acetyltransferase-like isoleucine patch superfamily enzyme